MITRRINNINSPQKCLKLKILNHKILYYFYPSGSSPWLFLRVIFLAFVENRKTSCSSLTKKKKEKKKEKQKEKKK